MHRYAWVLPTDNNVTMPMFTIAYEELYDKDLLQVTAVRIYKFVFDKKHSDSELCRRLLDENRDTFVNAGVAHAPNVARRKGLVTEQKQARAQMGGISGGSNLEEYAAMQYAGIINEEVWFRRLVSYGGRNMHNEGRPFIDDAALPNGVNNKRISSDPVVGGTHPYSPEYVFNARRAQALRAGLVDLETSELIDVHPDFLNPEGYWTDSGEFMLPFASEKKGGFFFLVNPYVTNIFDVALPRPVYGSACAGPNILSLYRETFYQELEDSGGTNASLLDAFNGMMTQKDPTTQAMEKQMAETILTYDSIDSTEMDRKGLRHYGEVDTKNNFIIEPRQCLKDLQQETRRVLEVLVQPWLKKRERLRADLNTKLQTDPSSSTCRDIDYYDDGMKELRDFESATTKRHFEVMKDLICLHLNRIEDAMQSKIERENIPQGYLAMYDGLQKALSKMPNKTANVAFAHDVALQFDDVSSFAQINLWLGEFWEKDCFSNVLHPNSHSTYPALKYAVRFLCTVEGRDRRIMASAPLYMQSPALHTALPNRPHICSFLTTVFQLVAG